eukprot:12916661-Prorocentrum_lima.AAC.1
MSHPTNAIGAKWTMMWDVHGSHCDVTFTEQLNIAEADCMATSGPVQKAVERLSEVELSAARLVRDWAKSPKAI